LNHLVIFFPAIMFNFDYNLHDCNWLRHFQYMTTVVDRKVIFQLNFFMFSTFRDLQCWLSIKYFLDIGYWISAEMSAFEMEIKNLINGFLIGENRPFYTLSECCTKCLLYMEDIKHKVLLCHLSSIQCWSNTVMFKAAWLNCLFLQNFFVIFSTARAAYGEIDASEGRRLRKRPEPKEAPPAKKASPVSSLLLS